MRSGRFNGTHGASPKRRHRRRLVAAFLILNLGACAFSPKQMVSSSQSIEVMRTGAVPADSSANARGWATAAQVEDVPSDSKVPSPAPPTEEPILVIELPPATDALAPEMEVRLREVAETVKADERISLLLEGFVPDGGSPALNINLAEQSLALVRRRLIAMRVPASRIQTIPFGEHHNRGYSPSNHWVEIYYRIRDR